MIRIMPHFICVNGREFLGIGFWIFARGASVHAILASRNTLQRVQKSSAEEQPTVIS